MLHSYLPILVFAALGLLVGGIFATVNLMLGPRRAGSSSATRRQDDPYESGIPVEVRKTFRFGVSFYLIAMLFILFDIEVIFLYPVGSILAVSDSVFVLGEIVLFALLLMVALIYVWRKGALDWR